MNIQFYKNLHPRRKIALMCGYRYFDHELFKLSTIKENPLLLKKQLPLNRNLMR